MREVQEAKADERLAEVMTEARTLRERINESLNRAEREIQAARKLAAVVPPDAGVARRIRRWRWFWTLSL